MTERTKAEPGLHRGMPFDEYLALDAISRTEILALMRSPARFRFLRDRGALAKKETDAMRAGSAIHCAVLEPERFEIDYVIADEPVSLSVNDPVLDFTAEEITRAEEKGKPHPGQAALKKGVRGKGYWRKLHDDNPGRIILRKEQGEEVAGVRDAIHRSEHARAMLTAGGDSELVVVWDDSATGVRCKARLDRTYKTARGSLQVVDLKSTTNVETDPLFRWIRTDRLYLQGAFYCDGLSMAVRGEEADHVFGGTPFTIVAYEREAPHEPAVVDLSGTALQVGQDEYRDALRLYARCVETDRWPDASGTIQRFDLPTYHETWTAELFAETQT